MAASADAPEIVTAMTTLLDDEDLLTFLGRVLRAVDQPDALTALRALVDLAADRLRARLAQPVRDPDDWSIEPSGACGRECRECRDFDVFLADPARRTVEWRLNEQFRRHIEDRIRTNELPVDHHTVKLGRPYTIALAKSPFLFDREAQQRREDEEAGARRGPVAVDPLPGPYPPDKACPDPIGGTISCTGRREDVWPSLQARHGARCFR